MAWRLCGQVCRGATLEVPCAGCRARQAWPGAGCRPRGNVMRPSRVRVQARGADLAVRARGPSGVGQGWARGGDLVGYLADKGGPFSTTLSAISSRMTRLASSRAMSSLSKSSSCPAAPDAVRASSCPRPRHPHPAAPRTPPPAPYGPASPVGPNRACRSIWRAPRHARHQTEHAAKPRHASRAPRECNGRACVPRKGGLACQGREGLRAKKGRAAHAC